MFGPFILLWSRYAAADAYLTTHFYLRVMLMSTPPRLEALPSTPPSLKLNSLLKQKAAARFPFTVLPAVVSAAAAAAAAAACHHAVTLQMEPGIHIIKTKMLGHNS